MDKNDVIIIDLDRPRELRFGHKALKTMLKLTGKKLEEMDMDNFDLEELEKIMYCGLVSDAKTNGEDLKLADMEDLLDHAPFNVIMEKMQEAFAVAFGSFDEDPNGAGEGNQANGTGTSPSEQP